MTMSIYPDPNVRTVHTTETAVDPDGRVVPVEQVVTPVAPAGAVVVEPAMHRSVVTSTGQRFAFDSFVVGIVGLVLMIVGLIAVTRAGFDGPMDDPVVEVMGFTHTATLGLIEVGIGLCLLLCAAITSRSGATFFGLLLGVAAFVGAVQTESFDRSLALESGHAWLAVIAAVIVVLVSLLVPRMVTRTDRVQAI
jgi:hypothetical protein